MNFHIIIYIIASFLVSVVCGLVCIPAIIRFCVDRQLYDLPNARKIHKSDIPRLGGISFLPSMLLASMLTIVVFNQSFAGKQMSISLWTITFFISLMLIYAVGFIDDLVGLGAKTKFIVQIVAATLMPAAGLYINNLYGLFGINEIPFLIGAPLTVFVMVFIINAMNLIDGIDGLSGGLSLLALSGFLLFFAREEVWLYCMMIAGLMGVVVSFLYFNIFGDASKCHKVFMGDTGSLTLGFILAFLLVKFSMDNPNVKPFRWNNMLLAYTLLIVPAFDVVRVVIVRFKHHKPLFDADKNHIHHKLIRAGLSQHGALLAILGLALLYIVLNTLLGGCRDFGLVVVVDIVLYVAFHLVVNTLIRHRGASVYSEV